MRVILVPIDQAAPAEVMPCRSVCLKFIYTSCFFIRCFLSAHGGNVVSGILCCLPVGQTTV